MMCFLFIIAFSMATAGSNTDPTVALLNATDSEVLMENTTYSSSNTFSVFGIIRLPSSIVVFDHRLDTRLTCIIVTVVILVALIMLTCIILCWCRKNGVRNICCLRQIVKYCKRRAQKTRYRRKQTSLNSKIYREKKIEIELKKRASKESIEPKDVIPDV
ncbi:hypothetical protein B9Z55_024087 [Caenorhabditis nigoni]|nr:hypothetical protein B9Z55_024087 [Caenorhabditis nigoni]